MSGARNVSLETKNCDIRMIKPKYSLAQLRLFVLIGSFFLFAKRTPSSDNGVNAISHKIIRGSNFCTQHPNTRLMKSGITSVKSQAMLLLQLHRIGLAEKGNKGIPCMKNWPLLIEES